MKINPTTFGLAGAIAATILWSLYSAVVLLLLIVSVNISGDMAYTDFSNFDWKFFVNRFLLFLGALSLSAGIAGWLTAAIYNFLNEFSIKKLP